MYSIYDYGKMIMDAVRMDAYYKALHEIVKPSCVVVDIGTGTGIFALLACQFGARKVYAIETNDAIVLAQQIAKANGYDERIEFIQDFSTQVSLPEQVDIVICDMHGVLPMYSGYISAIIDARQRFLAPNGLLIPQQESLWAALIEAPDLYEPFTMPWDNNAYDLDMRAGHQFVSNTWRKIKTHPEQLLVEAQSWANLDYRTIESPNVSGNIVWQASRSGTAHGLSLWFDAILSDDIGFSNAPDAPELVYGNAFFPLSEAVDIEVNDTIEVSLQANLVGEDYIWSWHTRISDGEQLKADFKQSTFYGTALSAKQLRKRASGYVPRLSEQGQVDQLILELMSRTSSLGEIAEEILSQFPRRFSNAREALSYVGELSQRYS
jgi:predicted RNA methylase